MAEQVYEVEDIVSKRVKNGRTEYFIQWKGYSKRHNSWVIAENLDCPKILTEFEAKNQNKSESIETSSGDPNKKRTRTSDNTRKNISGGFSVSKTRIASNKASNASNVTRLKQYSSGKQNLLHENNQDGREKISNASEIDETKTDSCKSSTSKNTSAERKRSKKIDESYDAPMEIESWSESDAGNTSDFSDSSSIMDGVKLTSTMKTSVHKEKGSVIPDSNVFNKERARERENTLENIKDSSSVFKKKNTERIAYSSSQNKIIKTTSASPNHIISELQKYTQKGLDMLNQQKRTETVSASVRLSECDLNKLTFNEVTENFADGLLHAKFIATPRENKLELYNQIRRLRTTSSNKSLNWFFCTQCGRVLYFNTNSHYNQLTRHKSNDCLPQFTGQDKIYMSRNNFIGIVESAMKIGFENGPASIPDTIIPDKWTKNNTNNFLNCLKTTDTVTQNEEEQTTEDKGQEDIIGEEGIIGDEEKE